MRTIPHDLPCVRLPADAANDWLIDNLDDRMVSNPTTTSNKEASHNGDDDVEKQEQVVPLVTATTHDQDEEQDERASGKDGRTFLLIAPADLRKGSRLDIITREGTTSVVRVPEAVQRGQAFRAKECGPLLNRWYDGEFDCVGAHNKCDWGFCLLTTCCPWISWGYMARKMNLDACGRPTQSRCVVMWTFYGTVMLGILQHIMPHYILWIL